MKDLIETGTALGLTLGRGGSKGLPGKNVRPLHGRPLITWAIAAGLASRSLDRVLCSTDDDEIAEACRAWGGDVPFRRPAEFAQDHSTDLDVFSHALEWLARNERRLPEFMVQLRPTQPFREPEWIDRAIALMRADRTITCVRSVAMSPITPYKMWKLDSTGRLLPLLELEGVAEPFNMPRQKLPPVYWHTGQLDVIRTDTLLDGSMTGNNIQALVVDVDTAVDIDHATDFKLAELEFERLMPRSLTEFIPNIARQGAV
jgi:CMP-N,N'-diacetyllegionaminic acid synthase